MNAEYERPVDLTYATNLQAAFEEGCTRHGIPADSTMGCDVALIMRHAFEKGVTGKDALLALLENLIEQ
jgi:hypothetical protein